MKNKEKALAALLTCDTQREAAAMCGLTDRTLRLYLADDEFSKEYRRRKRQLVSEATKQLQASYQAAIKALRDIVESEESSEGARISAARCILEIGTKFTETNDVLTGMEELEEAAKRQKGN